MALAGVAGDCMFPAFDLNGFIEVGPKVGNLDSSAICAELVDVTALMLGLNAVGCDDGLAPVIGTLVTFVGKFDATGVGFIVTGVGFIITGIGFIMAGIGFVMTGIGFIMPPMAGIPDVMESRFRPSSVSTVSETFRRVFRDIIRAWSWS